jgi:uncharacterized protein YndB with AHSA1/START domain
MNTATHSPTTLELSRHFDAPPEAVFDAWLQKSWGEWAGPPGVRGEVVQLEPRVGGHYRIVMHTPDGKDVPVALKSETVLGPDKRPRWKKGGEVRTFPKGQLWWSLHDPDYKELLDTRGKDDLESPLGQWTKVECICKGNTIEIRVNGTTVNKAFDVYPAAGKILLQSEGFEIYFRNVELRPIQDK